MKKQLLNKEIENIATVYKKRIGIGISIFLFIEGYALYPVLFNPKSNLFSYQSLMLVIGGLVAFFFVGMIFRVIYMNHKLNSSLLIFVSSFICIFLGFVMWFVTEYGQSSFDQTFDFKTASLYLVGAPLIITLLSLLPIKMAHLPKR